MDTATIILLFYKYVDISNPTEILVWQKKLCHNLSLKGRIIIAREGINGTLSGSDSSIQLYKKAMSEHLLFADIDFKQSSADHIPFPRMRIVIKNEIVHLGIDPDKVKASQGGTHLKPAQVHELLNDKPENLIIIDCRNTYESRIGHFKDAIIPNTKYFRQFPEYVQNNKSLFESKNVLMYCTGGVRCERASAYVKQETAAQQVYQIEGGIHRYIEEFPDGHFRGKNYVFDGRIQVRVNEDVLSTCIQCQKPWDTYINCYNVTCNAHVIICQKCIIFLENACSAQCQTLLQTKQVPSRMDYHKNKLSRISS